MPSPTWSTCPDPPIAFAIAAATAEAWNGPDEGASVRFTDALRQMVGSETFERIELRALDMFLSQPAPPMGYEPPPPWAWFQICPGCQKLRRTKHPAPQHGRAKLEALRDADWLAGQIERGRSATAIAEQVGASPSLVVYWLERHGLKSARTMAAQEFDAQVKSLHQDGEAPGSISRKLRATVQRVRTSLARQGIANKKGGHHYFRAEWWEERIVRRGMTKYRCAREAGIRPHVATYWVKKFGLQHLVRGNTRPVKYPILADAGSLRELLDRHLENYASAAREVGCAPSLIRIWAKKLLGAAPKHSNSVPHGDPEWWRERLEAGKTTWEMAEEAGIAEKSARERLRLIGLLEEAYRNNTRAERERRSA